MLRYAVRRTLLVIPTFIGASMLIFFAGFALPGDPVTALGGERAMPEHVRRNLIERYNLDKPVWQQYVLYMGGLVQGDLGESILRRRQVSDIFRETFPVTARLALFAVAIEVVIGLTAGVLAALRRGKFLDQLILVSTTLIVAIPVFILGFAARSMIGGSLRWLPVGGLNDGFRSYVMPAGVLAAVSLAYVARLTRTSLAETMREDFIRTAQSKGLRPSRVTGRHALRNALLPVVTFIAIDLGFLLGGAVVTETIFSIPGVGFTLIRAISTRDHAIVIGFTMAAVTVFLLISLITDLIYGYLDPRIRYE